MRRHQPAPPKVRKSRIDVKSVVRTYNRGRLFFDPYWNSYIRFDPQTGVVVVVDKIKDGTVKTLFQQNNPSSRWVPIKWRSGTE